MTIVVNEYPAWHMLGFTQSSLLIEHRFYFNRLRFIPPLPHFVYEIVMHGFYRVAHRMGLLGEMLFLSRSLYRRRLLI